MSPALLKKAQHVILENIPLVLIILLLFIGFVVFSTQLKSKNIQEEQVKMNGLKTAEVAQTVLALNTLQCSIGSFKEESCIDYFKLNSIALNSEEYFDLFGYSTIKLSYKTISGLVEEKVVYEKIKEDFQAKNVFFTPVIVYNPDVKENYFGILEVEVYT